MNTTVLCRGAHPMSFWSYDPDTPPFISIHGAWELFALPNPALGFSYTQNQASKDQEAMKFFTRAKSNLHNIKISLLFWPPLATTRDHESQKPMLDVFNPKMVEGFLEEMGLGLCYT